VFLVEDGRGSERKLTCLLTEFFTSEKKKKRAWTTNQLQLQSMAGAAPGRNAVVPVGRRLFPELIFAFCTAIQPEPPNFVK
jgi:hypothetical protein